MRTIANLMSAALAALLALVVTAMVSFAASEFEGTWKVADTGGNAYEITLAADGTAKGTHEEGMTGTWKAEGASVVITWNSGWTTKIAKDGDTYKKTAFQKGAPLDGPPTNTSGAEKLK